MTAPAVEAAIDRITKRLRNETIDALAEKIFNEDKSQGLASAIARARAHVEKAWKTRSGRVHTVSGKQLISDLSQWSKDKFNVSFGVIRIARNPRKE